MQPRRFTRLILLLCCLGAIGDVTAQEAGSQPILMTANVATGRTSVVNIQIAGAAENTVTFSPLRSTANIVSISLFDQAGRRVWQKSPQALGMVPRSQVRDPEQGDSINLPQIRNAAIGAWRLEIEGGPGSPANGVVRFVYSVLDRFGLTLQVGAPAVYAGEPVLVTVRPTDYGKQMGGLGQITVLASRSDGSGVLQIDAVEFARTPEGVAMTTEPGTYIARVKFEQPGNYRLEAKTRTVGENGARTHSASGTLMVGNRVAALKLVGLREKQPEGGGCVQRVFVEFDVHGEDETKYALNVSFPGRDGKTMRANQGFEMAGRTSRQSVPIEAKDLQVSDAPATKLLRVALLKMDRNGARVVDEQLGWHVIGAGEAAKRACR